MHPPISWKADEKGQGAGYCRTGVQEMSIIRNCISSCANPMRLIRKQLIRFLFPYAEDLALAVSNGPAQVWELKIVVLEPCPIYSRQWLIVRVAVSAGYSGPLLFLILRPQRKRQREHANMVRLHDAAFGHHAKVSSVKVAKWLKIWWMEFPSFRLSNQ